jgi:hypothetical protein
MKSFQTSNALFKEKNVPDGYDQTSTNYLTNIHLGTNITEMSTHIRTEKHKSHTPNTAPKSQSIPRVQSHHATEITCTHRDS